MRIRRLDGSTHFPATTTSRSLVVLALLLAAARSPADAQPSAPPLDASSLSWIQTLLHSWEIACARHLNISPEPLPWIILYDVSGAWHLNPESQLLPDAEVTTDSVRFGESTYVLTRVAHEEGRLWVPEHDPIEIVTSNPQIVTMLYDRDRKPFFIMPLPGLYRGLAGPAEASDLDRFFLGLAAHELTHTRQLAYVAPRIRRLRTRYALPDDIDDNVIERTFGGDDRYRTMYDNERELLTAAILATDADSRRDDIRATLSIAEERKRRFFSGDNAGYSDLDDLFLTMEGVAMWVQYQVAREWAPDREDWLQTLVTLSERTDAWSQEQGLGLFLLIDGLVPRWQERFLAPDFPSPFTVLREAIR